MTHTHTHTFPKCWFNGDLAWYKVKNRRTSIQVRWVSPDRPIVGMYQSVVCCSTYCPDLRPLQEEEWFTRAFFELSMILAVTPCMSIVSGAGIV